MADAEYEPGSEAANAVLAGLKDKLQNDTDAKERAQELVLNLQDIQTKIGAAKSTAAKKHRGDEEATALNRMRPDDFPPVNVYVQVNTSGEDSKSGLEPFSEELWDTISTIRKECPKLKLRGLMTIGAIARSQAVKEGEENEDFITLVQVATEIEERIEQEDGEKVVLSLSMGMSDDFENAISLGAGCVRVGSSIFGARPKKADATIL
ncbi:hypothetical protein AA313_de0206640 [Arthrobotrys entomopaga]|nr:hypothetical protein AA313_de0206640 [Arthrobotrys entomopaga]